MQHGRHTPTYSLTEAYNLSLQHTMYMVNRQLSKQGICLPVSYGHITGSGLELTKVTKANVFLKLITDQVHVPVLDWITGSCQVNWVNWEVHVYCFSLLLFCLV